MIPMILSPPHVLHLQGQTIIHLFIFFKYYLFIFVFHFLIPKSPHHITGGIFWAQKWDIWMYPKVSVWYPGAKGVSRLSHLNNL